MFTPPRSRGRALGVTGAGWRLGRAYPGKGAVERVPADATGLAVLGVRADHHHLGGCCSEPVDAEHLIDFSIAT